MSESTCRNAPHLSGFSKNYLIGRKKKKRQRVFWEGGESHADPLQQTTGWLIEKQTEEGGLRALQTQNRILRPPVWLFGTPSNFHSSVKPREITDCAACVFYRVLNLWMTHDDRSRNLASREWWDVLALENSLHNETLTVNLLHVKGGFKTERTMIWVIGREWRKVKKSAKVRACC